MKDYMETNEKNQQFNDHAEKVFKKVLFFKVGL